MDQSSGVARLFYQGFSPGCFHSSPESNLIARFRPGTDNRERRDFSRWSACHTGLLHDWADGQVEQLIRHKPLLLRLITLSPLCETVCQSAGCTKRCRHTPPPPPPAQVWVRHRPLFIQVRMAVKALHLSV